MIRRLLTPWVCIVHMAHSQNIASTTYAVNCILSDARTCRTSFNWEIDLPDTAPNGADTTCNLVVEVRALADRTEVHKLDYLVRQMTRHLNLQRVRRDAGFRAEVHSLGFLLRHVNPIS